MVNNKGIIYYYPTARSQIYSTIRKAHQVDPTFIDILKTENFYPMVEQKQEQSFLVITLPIYSHEKNRINTLEIDIIITSKEIILSTNTNNNFIKELCISQKKYNTIDVIIHNIIQSFCISILDNIKYLEHKTSVLKDSILNEKSITKDLVQNIMETKMNIGVLRSTIDPFVDIITHIQEVILIDSKKIENDQIDHYIKQIQSQGKFIYETIAIIADSADALQTIHTNNIMKVLAIISTIFIPLSFVTGIFGMNFTDLPIDNTLFYYFTIATMVFIGFYQLYAFKKRKRF